MLASTTRPKVRAMPTWVTAPPRSASMMMAPVPAKTRANVPKNSAAHLRMRLLVRIGVRWARKIPRLLRGAHLIYCRARQLHAVELVVLRRVAPRRAAQRPSGAAHSVRSTRTGLSQRDKHHPQKPGYAP